MFNFLDADDIDNNGYSYSKRLRPILFISRPLFSFRTLHNIILYFKIVLPVYLIIMLPVIVIAQNGLEIYIINTLAGAMAIFTFSYFDRGWLQFINSFFVFGGLAFAYSSFRLIEEGSFSNFSLTLYGYFFWNSLFCNCCLSIPVFV